MQELHDGLLAVKCDVPDIKKMFRELDIPAL